MNKEALEYINYPAITLAGILLWIWCLQKQMYELQKMIRPDGDLGMLDEEITRLKEVNQALKTEIDLKSAVFENDWTEKDKEIERLNAQCEVVKLEMERVRLEMNQQSQMHRQAIETHHAETERLKVVHQAETERLKVVHQAETERLKVVHQAETERLKDTHEVETKRLKEIHQAAMERQQQDHQEEMDKMRQEHAHQLEMAKCKSRQDMEEMLQLILERLPATQITTNGVGSPAI